MSGAAVSGAAYREEGLAFHDIDRIDAVVEPHDWPFPRDHAADIARYWQEFAEGKPGMFNGTVLVQHRGGVDGKVFRAAYSVTDYKTFLGFLRLPLESPGVRNGFGMAALRARDGAFLLGEMGASTANAGKIYFPAGTPDLGDVVNGTVDLAGSVLRELCEETGLRADEVRIGTGWTAIYAPKRVAFMRPASIDLPAEEARRLILDRMKHLHEDELSGMVVLRPGDALLDDPRLPNFVSAYIRRAFDEG